MRLEHPDVDQKMRESNLEVELAQVQKVEQLWEDALPDGDGYRGKRG